MLRKMLVLLAVSAAVVPASAQAKFFKFGMNEEEVKAVVKDYLLENPEIIKEAMDNYARRQEEAKKQGIMADLSSDFVFEILDRVLAEKADVVAQYKAEQDPKILNFLVGQVMRETHGKASAADVMEKLKEKIK